MLEVQGVLWDFLEQDYSDESSFLGGAGVVRGTAGTVGVVLFQEFFRGQLKEIRVVFYGTQSDDYCKAVKLALFS